MATRIPDFSLRIAKGLAPFALVGEEREMKPEDWAWQFLRLNSEYRQAYEKAAKRYKDGCGAAEKDTHELRTVRIDERICRERFGLSTWLDPHCRCLPALQEGQSWFAPLRSVRITYSRDLGDKRGPDEPELDFSAQDSIFGLQKGKARQSLREVVIRERGKSAYRPRFATIDFHIDCSRPINGQLASAAFLANAYAKQFRNRGLRADRFELTEQSGSCLLGVIPPPEQGDKSITVFASERVKLSAKEREDAEAYLALRPDERYARLPANESARAKVVELLHKAEKVQRQATIETLIDPATVESEKAITVNIADDVSRQLKQNSMLLRVAREWLMATQVADAPAFERLWFRLAAGRGRAAQGPTDGHRLKAYVLIKECQLAGITKASEMLDVFRHANPSTDDLARELSDEWLEYLRGREGRLLDYAKDAEAFISEQYVCLVDTQTPNE